MRYFPASDDIADRQSVEKRVANRVDVRNGDGLSARLCLANGAELELRVYNISLSGVSVVATIEQAEVIQEGQVYALVIVRAWDVPLNIDAMCIWSAADKNRHRRYGFSFFPDQSSARVAEIDKLRQRQLTVSRDLPIHGYLYKELYYRERLCAEIVSIGKRSLTFSIEDTECFMIPGMQITINVGTAHEPAGQLQCEMVESKLTSSGATIVCEILKFPDSLQTWLNAWLLSDQQYTPADLRRAGFMVRNTANLFRFRFVNSATDYHEVLKLRLNTYIKAGKLPVDTELEAMRAPLDSMSRILTVYHGKQLIASCAMAFPTSHDTILDTERTLAGGYPSDLPSKLEIIEISRLCVHSDYRHGDILVRMFEQMYRVCLASDRSYMISSTDRKLWPLYKSIGFTKTDHCYDHPVFAGVEHTIISIHLDTPLRAKGLPHARWLHLYRDVNEFMQSRIGLRYSTWQSLKLRTASLLAGSAAEPKNREY